MVGGLSSSQNVVAELATKEIRKRRKAVEGGKKSVLFCFKLKVGEMVASAGLKRMI